MHQHGKRRPIGDFPDMVALPAWPHSRSWGYYPSGGLGLVLIILIVLMLLNRV